MNYRHAYHAGNFADVMKHAVLCRVLMHLRGKPGAFRVIDTHAGAGVYDLRSAAAGKTRELNVYAVEYGHRDLKRLFLVDLPGYGYARGGDVSANVFAGLTTMYFGRPAPAAGLPGDGGGYGPTGALLIVDARHPGLAQDLNAWAWLSTQDLAIGHYTSSDGGRGAGKVTLLSGATGTVLRTITSTTRGENFGFDTVGLGDVNGDGLPDLLVSAATGQAVYVIAGAD